MTTEHKNSRRVFFKYTSADAAKLIFKNETFKWSSPLIFNDPFDTQSGLHMETDLNRLPQLIFERIEQLIFAEITPVFVNANVFSDFIMEMRKTGASSEQVKEKLKPTKPLLQLLAEKAKKTTENMLGVLEKPLKEIRVLSLSEDHDNILMWSHYADYHKGVVIKIKFFDEIQADDALWTAQPIEYCSTSMPIVSGDYIEHLLGLKNSPIEFRISDYVRKKWDIWKYEKEWRLWTKAEAEDGEGYCYRKFNFRLVDSIYFGCRCEENDMKEIIETVSAKKADVEYFKASKHEYAYKLDFEELKMR